MNGFKAVAVAGTLSVSLLVIVSGIAQPQSPNDRTVASLNAAAKARISWDFAKAKTADVTCDGKPDHILFGLSAGKIWMGMLPGGGGQPQTWSFRWRAPSNVRSVGSPSALKFIHWPATRRQSANLKGAGR
jgi:hypothetical protein